MSRSDDDYVTDLALKAGRGDKAALTEFIASADGRPMRIFCTYTAMLALRRMLGERYALPEMGADADETQGAQR